MSGKPYAEVIGDPIAHSKSPLIYNFWLGKLGIDAEYRACHVRADELEDYFAQRRGDAEWRGCNVTMPHKERTLGLVDWLDDMAKDTVAANCVFKEGTALGATNTDVWGVATTLGLLEAKDPIVIIGAGGAARAVLKNLSMLGALEVHLVARDLAKAQALLTDFDLYGEAWRLGEKLDIPFTMLLINASPLGMAGKAEMPAAIFDLVDGLKQHAMVFDMVYAPPETPLLKAALARGLQAVNGLGMLVDQARQSFELFFGVRPPMELDEQLFELLTA